MRANCREVRCVVVKIVHVYKDFWPPIVGGIERTVNWMVSGLRGVFEFTVLVNSRTRQTRERMWEGIRIIEVGEWGRVLSAPIAPTFPLWLRRLKADVWHFHIPNPTGDVSWLLSRPEGRVVATYHSDVIRQRWAMAAYGPFLHAFLSRCAVIMPTSPRQQAQSPVLQRHSERCVPVPLGMPLAPFARTAATGGRVREIKRALKGFPLLVFVGKLRYYKGVQFLISAMRQLPQVRLAIIGAGPEGRKLRALSAELGLGDRIQFLGELPDEEVVAWMQAAELFVLPSHLPSEAFGLVQVEAMACGTPVISCELQGGVPFVNQDGVTGRIVAPADDTALALAVGELLENPSRRFAMGEAAYRRAHSEFSQEVMCGRVAEVYRRLNKS